MDISFHYPPDLFNLLVDTIPRLCRSKKDVILFLRGAGVESSVYADQEQQLKSDPKAINKFDIVRTILTRLNAHGEGTLRERREILKRVIEFEEFEACWDTDRLKAKGLVASVRNLVNVRDSFTRMHNERESERRQRQEEIERQHREKEKQLVNLRAARDKFYRVFAEQDHHRRGKLLEGALNDLFAVHGVGIREAFTLQGEEKQGTIEQIDGVIEFEGNIYLIEVKWWGDPLGPGEISQHLVRVYHRGHARGIFVSGTGYTPAAIIVCKEALQKTVVVLCELQEFVHLLEREQQLQPFLREKVRAAIIEKDPHRTVVLSANA